MARAILAVHAAQDAVGAALQRRVDMLRDTLRFGDQPEEIVREVHRLDRAEAETLDFGLGERAAAATLAGAVSAALVDGPQTPDLLRRGMGATTREFTSRVVSAFQLTQPWGSAA